MKLYEIDNEIMNCLDAETGEIINAEKLSFLQIERDNKIENVGLWIKNLKAEAEAIKQEKLYFAERQKKAENKIEQLEKWLAYSLNNTPFKTPVLEITFRKSKSVNIIDANLIDEKYLKYAEPTIDKNAIRNAINNNEVVAGAEIQENINISVK